MVDNIKKEKTRLCVHPKECTHDLHKVINKILPYNFKLIKIKLAGKYLCKDQALHKTEMHHTFI